MHSRRSLCTLLLGFALTAPCQLYRPNIALALGQSGKKITKPAPAVHSPLPPVELPQEPGLYAVIYTSQGEIVCRLFDKDAPKTVANFRGLATGSKAWKNPDNGRLLHKPLYNGTTFHRVIPGFMIQGGDPKGDGTGGPGYEFANENTTSVPFDKPGILAMANAGPDTNGSQFFITVAAAEHLNGHYSVFGEVVKGQEIADAISNVSRNGEDRPDAPVMIKTIAIKTVGATPSKR